MTQHTPGPWETSRDATPEAHPQFTVYAESNGDRVATAFETEANARLIAAAPELLEACKIAEESMDPYAGEGCAADHLAYNVERAASELQAAFVVIRKAIRKAQGGTA